MFASHYYQLSPNMRPHEWMCIVVSSTVEVSMTKMALWIRVGVDDWYIEFRSTKNPLSLARLAQPMRAPVCGTSSATTDAW